MFIVTVTLDLDRSGNMAEESMTFYDEATARAWIDFWSKAGPVRLAVGCDRDGAIHATGRAIEADLKAVWPTWVFGEECAP